MDPIDWRIEEQPRCACVYPFKPIRLNCTITGHEITWRNTICPKRQVCIVLEQLDRDRKYMERWQRHLKLCGYPQVLFVKDIFAWLQTATKYGDPVDGHEPGPVVTS